MQTGNDAERSARQAPPQVFIASENAVLRAVLAHRAVKKGLSPVVANDVYGARLHLESNTNIALLLHTSDALGLSCRRTALDLCLLGRNITILQVDLHPDIGRSHLPLAAQALWSAVDHLLDAVAGGTLNSTASATSTTEPPTTSSPVPRILRHEAIALDVAKDTVTVDEHAVHLAPIPFRILKYLLFNLGRVIPESELVENALLTQHGTESSSLREHIRLLRQRLGKAGLEIKTIRGAGYGIGVAD